MIRSLEDILFFPQKPLLLQMAIHSHGAVSGDRRQGPLLSPCCTISVAQATSTKYHRPGGCKDRHSCSHSSRTRKVWDQGGGADSSKRVCSSLAGVSSCETDGVVRAPPLSLRDRPYQMRVPPLSPPLTFITSFQALSPNAVTLGVRAQHTILGEEERIHELKDQKSSA